VELLSLNYRATAQIANLLAEWLIMTGLKISEVQSLVEDHLKEMIIKHFDPKKADSIFMMDEAKVKLNSGIFSLLMILYSPLDPFLVS